MLRLHAVQRHGTKFPDVQLLLPSHIKGFRLVALAFYPWVLGSFQGTYYGHNGETIYGHLRGTTLEPLNICSITRMRILSKFECLSFPRKGLFPAWPNFTRGAGGVLQFEI